MIGRMETKFSSVYPVEPIGTPLCGFLYLTFYVLCSCKFFTNYLTHCPKLYHICCYIKNRIQGVPPLLDGLSDTDPFANLPSPFCLRKISLMNDYHLLQPFDDWYQISIATEYIGDRIYC